ncbi:hypothetical protein [Rhizobium leguminosarum]|uniref:hypothetical protein n=1 Tax=Rhizobium leguminosarum TaxID=384 RepID=UPI001C957164|nr:hypothetical protein [Rhizobium leguminosarum]
MPVITALRTSRRRLVSTAAATDGTHATVIAVHHAKAYFSETKTSEDIPTIGKGTGAMALAYVFRLSHAECRAIVRRQDALDARPYRRDVSEIFSRPEPVGACHPLHFIKKFEDNVSGRTMQAAQDLPAKHGRSIAFVIPYCPPNGVLQDIISRIVATKGSACAFFQLVTVLPQSVGQSLEGFSFTQRTAGSLPYIAWAFQRTRNANAYETGCILQDAESMCAQTL